MDMLHENAPFENGKPTTPLVLGKYVAVVAVTLTGCIEFDDVRVDQQAPSRRRCYRRRTTSAAW